MMDTSTIPLMIAASLVLLQIAYCSTTSNLSSSSTKIDQFKAQYLPAYFQRTNFTLNDVKHLLRQKCKKADMKHQHQHEHHHQHIYENVEAATVELLECVEEIGNFTEFLNEIDAARPVGELDVVFKKYCDKRPLAEQCLQNFNAHLYPCLTTAERSQYTILMRIFSTLLGFLCKRNGDPLAIFIAEQGPECFEQQKENIGNCMNATVAAYVRKNGETNMLNELPEFILTQRQCIDLYDFEECILNHLEHCNELTPANIIESMFKYVKNETNCDIKLKSEQMKNARGCSASNFRLNAICVLLTVIIFGFFKLN